MTSYQIKFLISFGVISAVYAFICQVRLTQKAQNLAEHVKEEHPDHWKDLSPIARSWNGGHPALKRLYRMGVLDLSKFKEQYMALHLLERHLVGGVIVGFACIGVVAFGLNFLGWSW